MKLKPEQRTWNSLQTSITDKGEWGESDERTIPEDIPELNCITNEHDMEECYILSAG